MVDLSATPKNAAMTWMMTHMTICCTVQSDTDQVKLRLQLMDVLSVCCWRLMTSLWPRKLLLYCYSCPVETALYSYTVCACLNVSHWTILLPALPACIDARNLRRTTHSKIQQRVVSKVDLSLESLQRRVDDESVANKPSDYPVRQANIWKKISLSQNF